jgi:hypothetical protein
VSFTRSPLIWVLPLSVGAPFPPLTAIARVIAKSAVIVSPPTVIETPAAEASVRVLSLEPMALA